MNTEIRLATERDIPALCEIWQVCFHDPEAYIRYFYRENFNSITVPVYVVNDRPVSMMHTMDASFLYGAKRQEAKYLYAGGTLPAYRKNGCYGALFEYLTAQARQNGHALFGKPASRDLIPYYQAFGFEPDACFRLVTVRPGEKIPLPVSALTPEAYNQMRNRVFSDRPYAKWPDRHLRWCVAENEWCGGKTLAVEMDHDVYFLIGAPRGNTLLITETNLSFSQLKRASGALCALFGTGLLQAYLPDFSCSEGEEIVSSIVYNAPLRNTYVNLLLI